MASDIVGGMVWAVGFFAIYPFITVGIISVVTTAPSHHVDGRGGFVRDYYRISLPLMPGGAALFAACVGTMDGRGGALFWSAAILVFVGGIAMFWTPPIQSAIARLRGAFLASAVAKPTSDQ